MNAKEMFEKLGYKKIEDVVAIQYINDGHQVRFWKDSKYVEMFGGKNFEIDLDNTEYYYASYELFIAINKQIEELGWLE